MDEKYIRNADWFMEQDSIEYMEEDFIQINFTGVMCPEQVSSFFEDVSGYKTIVHVSEEGNILVDMWR